MANQKKVITESAATKMNKVIEGHETTSAKIRALAAAGYERGDIARHLNKRYQHVRNVLTQPLKKGA